MTSSNDPKVLNVDTHSAKAEQAGLRGKGFSGEHTGIPRTPEQQQNTFGHSLQTTIELDKILQLFYQEIERSLSVSGMSYTHAANQYEHTFGEPAGNSSLYRLQTSDDYLGEINCYRSTRFREQELAIIEQLIRSLVYPLRNGLQYEEAVKRALMDPLTGAGNRICMENALTREFQIATRYQDPFSILLLDIDHFKSINDHYGHTAGDAVLKAVVRAIQNTHRHVDMTFRYGGEEFVVILNKTDLTGAKITAERIRAAVAGLSIIFEQQDIPVTISIGVATLQHGESRQLLFDRADQALYHTKTNGRNQICALEPVWKACKLPL